MKHFVLYERRSKEDKTKLVSHTFATQEWMVDQYLKTQGVEGVDWVIVEHFVETRSGGKYYTKRPEFSKAVELCKKDRNLTLLASKPDRICRNMRTGAELMETINMTIASCPHASDLELHMAFMMAQNEWKMISERFIQMHAAKRSRGEKVGAASPNYKRNSLNIMNKRTSTKAKEWAEKYRPQMSLMASEGWTLAKMADKMKVMDLRSPRGKHYYPSGISNLLGHLKLEITRAAV